MARSIRDAKLDTRTARLKLPHRVNPHWTSLGPGQSLGYYRPQSRVSGTWIARFLDPDTRKQARKKLGTADDYQDADGSLVLSHEEAKKKAQAWFDQARESATGERVHRGPYLVSDALDAYLDHLDQEGKRSAKDARKRTDLHIRPSLGGLEVAKLTRIRLDKWKTDLAESPKVMKTSKRPAPKRPRKPLKKKATPKPPKTLDEKRARKASANRVLSTLKAALNYAKAHGLVRCSDDAWRSVKPFRAVEESRQHYLTPEEQTRLLNAIKDRDFKRLVMGALLTGCRYGELASMQVGDVDLKGGTVLIRQSKSGKSRRARLTVEGKAFFESITPGRKHGETLFQRDEAIRRVRPKDQDPLAWGPAEQTRRMHAACEAAELPKMGFHQLRHSYASALVAAGMPLAYVAQLTGHADTRMLEKHYAHLAPSDLTRSLEALAPKLGVAFDPIANLKTNKAKAQ